MITMQDPKDAALRNLVLPPVGTTMTPAACKALAVLIAQRGLGQVAPNPLVGAVLVDTQQRFIAAGAHLRLGQAHAEIAAIEQAAAAGTSLAGATLYVTLEPCAHVSRTPACAPRVAASGIKQVVYGVRDPNPRVDGRGAEILRSAGVVATLDPTWEAECSALAEIFLWNMRTGTPFVGVKVAAGLDGVMAVPGDQRVWITGARARAYGHFLRVYYDALAIGRGTLLADDPLLNARDSLWRGRSPKRVVIDPDASGLLAKPVADWRLMQTDPHNVCWITGEKLGATARAQIARLKAFGAHWISVPKDAHGQFAAAALLQELHAWGVTSLLLEGGAGLYAPFFRAKEVNRLHLFQAPKCLGAASGIHFAADVGELAASGPAALTPLGNDWLIDLPLARRAAAELS